MELQERLREQLFVQFGACQAWHDEGEVKPGRPTDGGVGMGQTRKLRSSEMFASHKAVLDFW